MRERLPYAVSNDGAFAGVHRDAHPKLTVAVDGDVMLFWQRLRTLLYRKVSLPRPIGFTAKWHMDGDDWRATW